MTRDAPTIDQDRLIGPPPRHGAVSPPHAVEDHARQVRGGEETNPRATPLDDAVRRATEALLDLQRPDGHWVFELEADATIPAEYVLMVHYLGEEADPALEARIARYLRRVQGEDGGWPLFHEGASDVSASVKAYFALKMIGDPVDAPHMARARARILALGGAQACNVFTRTLLALYGVMPWRAVPMMPVELVLLPLWFPFHLSKISYWARTVVVPLLVLNSLRPLARNPRVTGIDELFTGPCQASRMPPRAPHQRRAWYGLFRGIDGVLRVADRWMPARLRARAVDTAHRWVRERINGEDGLGAIFPAMVNAVLMFDALAVPKDDPDAAAARAALDRLLVVRDDEAYCQPCFSPVWDTALACHALLETGAPDARAAVAHALDWLRPLQELETRGDWSVRRPGLRPGGWAFQYANACYPDVDDTAVVAMAFDRALRDSAGVVPPATAGSGRTPRDCGNPDPAVARALEWVIGMQGSDGGWGAFEPENTHAYLDNIPFADHGALLDPPTADVSARCLSMLAQCARPGAPAAEAGARALRYLLDEQCPDGSWFGRWGINYIYGTWSVLCALSAVSPPVLRASGRAAGNTGDGPTAEDIGRAIARAADWLLSVQNGDGGWGEDGDSYRLGHTGHVPAPSTPSQTAWALLGLMASGRTAHPAVARGVRFLVGSQHASGLWEEQRFTAVGFPRVFYLRYHGYARYFPLWALARYRRLTGLSARPGSGAEQAAPGARAAHPVWGL